VTLKNYRFIITLSLVAAAGGAVEASMAAVPSHPREFLHVALPPLPLLRAAVCFGSRVRRWHVRAGGRRRRWRRHRHGRTEGRLEEGGSGFLIGRKAVRRCLALRCGGPRPVEQPREPLCATQQTDAVQKQCATQTRTQFNNNFCCVELDWIGVSRD
jgi:hypothetical protein